MVGLFLAHAWNHLFWTTPYRAVLEGWPEIGAFLRLAPEAGDRVGLAFGVSFFLAGLVCLVWRPPWFARTMVVLGTVPMALCVLARGLLAPVPVAAWMVESWLIWLPLLLAASGTGDERGEGRDRMIAVWAKAGGTLVFGGWGLAVLVLRSVPGLPWSVLPAPEVGDVPALVFSLAAGVALAGCAMLWTRQPGWIASVLLGLASAAAVGMPLWERWAGGGVEAIHRAVAETGGGVALLVLAVSLGAMGGRENVALRRRKLRRVEEPEN